MTDLQSKPRGQAKLTALNETPLSRHVAELFQQGKVVPQPGALLLSELAMWALEETPDLDATWVEAVMGQLAREEQVDLEVVANALADVPDLMQVQTLREAGDNMLSLLVDLYPQGG